MNQNSFSSGGILFQQAAPWDVSRAFTVVGRRDKTSSERRGRRVQDDPDAVYTTPT